MTVDELQQSAQTDAAPPADLSPELKSLWLTKAERWDEAHDIAQDIDTKLGSWIHALLHLIEGDIGNAGYWFSRAGRPARGPEGINEEWAEIAAFALAQE